MQFAMLPAEAVVFEWQDNSDNEEEFRVERSTDGVGFAELATVAAGSTRFVDTDALPANRYWYRVRAQNANGASAYSEAVSVATAAAAAAPPAISALGDVTIPLNSFAGPLAFTVTDDDTMAENLVLSVSSSNSELVHPARIVLGGAGARRTVTIRPLAHRSGSAKITLSVSDGLYQVRTAFTVTVRAESLRPEPARLCNLSARTCAPAGADPVITGFVVGGTSIKRILLRAVGPTLGLPPFGLANVLANPRVVLKRWNGRGYDDFAANSDWGGSDNASALAKTAAQLFAFELSEASRDAALLVDLPPGQYTAVIDAETGDGGGVALAELYDASDAADASTLMNLSNRGFVGVGDNVMITGFVVAGDGAQTLLIRAIGPGLAEAPFRVADTLADPAMEIFRHNADGSDTLMMTQDNWGGSADAAYTARVSEQVSAFALRPGSKDSAFVVTLPAGAYTVVVRGADGGTGTALAEVYVVR